MVHINMSGGGNDENFDILNDFEFEMNERNCPEVNHQSLSMI